MVFIDDSGIDRGIGSVREDKKDIGYLLATTSRDRFPDDDDRPVFGDGRKTIP
jgi:hypothetical protein